MDLIDVDFFVSSLVFVLWSTVFFWFTVSENFACDFYEVMDFPCMENAFVQILWVVGS